MDIELKLRKKLVKEHWYTVRRYYVDLFHFRSISIFQAGDKVLDMGGKKERKRGEFDIENYSLKVLYANLSKETNPDFHCDIKKVPVDDDFFDGIILSEVLEHVKEPHAVLKEARRILKPNGKIIICTPFQYHVHADPCDYLRYTDYWFKETLTEIGFSDIKVEKHGFFLSVLCNMLKIWVYQLSKQQNSNSLKSKIFRRVVLLLIPNLMAIEKKNSLYSKNPVFAANTTGYGVIAVKS